MRPPMSSDSEDDYDGFSFGDEFDEPARNVNAIQTEWLSNQRRENEKMMRFVLTIKNGDLEGLKQELLQRYGNEARINCNDYLRDGWTLLLHAVSNLQFEIVSYLISKGANVNCEADSLTPLMLVCKLEPYPNQLDDILNMTRLLLSHGAIVNTRDKTGCTPFLFACMCGNKDIVNLLQNSCALDATDNLGNTSLHYAVENKHFEIVELLLNSGADIEIFNSAGQKPRDIAVFLGLTDVVALFPEEIPETFQNLAPSIFPDHEM